MGDSGSAEPSVPPAGPRSPILSMDRRADESYERYERPHAHPEALLLWSNTATLAVTAAARDWLVPPGYGLWIPGGTEHAVAALRFGEGSVITFAPNDCPITWAEPTGVPVGPLARELIAHLGHAGPGDSSRVHAEALLFDLLVPLPTHDIHVSVPADPRVRAVAERLIADPADQRELTDWADEVHVAVRTLSRLFRTETGRSFADWRAQVRMRAAVQLLAGGESVNVTARAVGYNRTSAFIHAFRRVTGQTPGTYRHADTVARPDPAG